QLPQCGVTSFHPVRNQETVGHQLLDEVLVAVEWVRVPVVRVQLCHVAPTLQELQTGDAPGIPLVYAPLRRAVGGAAMVAAQFQSEAVSLRALHLIDGGAASLPQQAPDDVRA